uniref:Uncharacterized protein n=1 Tax=Anopheles merus TaxID=30066 RepID=A0A182VH49_ANOME
MVDAEPTAAVVVLEEKKASECSEKSSDECHEANDGDVAVEEKSMPEEKPMEAETSEKKEDGEENAARMVSPAPPPAEPVAVECKSPPCAQEEPPKAEPKGEEEKRTETLLLPPPPPPPPAQPVTARVPAGGKASIVAPVLERPDSARLTADLQSCQRQLAEVRSKYDVTRKELHATKRKLKRMSVRLGNMTTGGGGGGSAASGGIVGGAASPHALAGGPADDDRNRKWREPMIVAAMKIKNAMGIQAYKSLIKDGELLLPSLRTITRYLESLRKAGGGAAAAAAVALASAGTAKPNAPMEVDELPEDEEDEDVEEEDDDVVAVRADGLVNRRLEPTGMVRKKQPKANGAPRTVDHNRNEQRRHPAAYPGAAQQQRHHHHGPEVQDIKTEQDPVSFTVACASEPKPEGPWNRTDGRTDGRLRISVQALLKAPVVDMLWSTASSSCKLHPLHCTRSLGPKTVHCWPHACLALVLRVPSSSSPSVRAGFYAVAVVDGPGGGHSAASQGPVPKPTVTTQHPSSVFWLSM